MELDYLLLADAVAVAEGKLYIHGAGWDTLFVTSFPATHPVLGVAGRLRATSEETNRPHTLEVDVVNDGDESILPEPPAFQHTFSLSQPINAAPGSDQLLPMAFSIAGLQFERAGTYAVVFRADNNTLARLSFNVVPPPIAPE